MTVGELAAALAKAGPEDASPIARTIIERFEPLLHRAWSPQSGEYEDFVQEVFLRVFRALPRLRNPHAFPGLFRTVVSSVRTDLWRKSESRRVFDPLDAPVHNVASSDDEVLVTALIVRSYLEHLESERERYVLMREFVDNASVREVAAELKIEPGAVRTLKSRALRALRKIAAREAEFIRAAGGDAF